MTFSYSKTYNSVDTGNIQAPGKDSSFIFKVPEGEDKALIVKFLVDPRSGGKSYIPVKHYPHLIGPNPDMHTRYHIAQERDIELDARISYYKELKALRATGSTDAVRMQQLSRLIERCKDKESGWFFVVEPNSSVVKALKVGISVINQLFGRVYKDKEPIPSLIKSVSQKGISPYDLSSENAELGWFKLYSTGSGLGKKYHVKLAEVEVSRVVDGETFTKKSPARYELDSKIKNLDLALEDFPNPLELEMKTAFSPEETQEFIDSGYTKVPSRFLTRRDGPAVAPVQAPADNYLPDLDFGGGLETPAVEVEEVSMDDLPF